MDVNVVFLGLNFLTLGGGGEFGAGGLSSDKDCEQLSE